MSFYAQAELQITKQSQSNTSIKYGQAESAHSDEVALLRSQYSEEDEETIQKFLQAKGTIRPEEIVQQLHNQMVQEETDQDSSSGKMIW